jgi:hypothetical protein
MRAIKRPKFMVFLLNCDEACWRRAMVALLLGAPASKRL